MLQVLRKAWDESEHPRDESGRFGVAGGGDETGPDFVFPDKPGTASVPEGNVRLYHQTGEDKLEQIGQQGIMIESARGIEGPKAIYADEQGFYGDPEHTPSVEFHVSKDRWQPPFVTGENVKPGEIIALHRPWHSSARYIEKNPETLRQVIAGEHDDLKDDRRYGPAIRYLQAKYGRVKKEWDESLHPRDEAGRFGFGGGGADSDEGGGGGGKGEHPGKGYSKGAYVDSKGVIQTSSVYDAQRALHENRKVELDQPHKVSVLLQKLGETSARMIKQGKEAPVFNLCNVSVKGTSLFCADTKGIPRVEMPQLDKQQTKDFQKYLKAQGYKVTKEKQFASHLRATQNELNGAKVARTAEKIAAEGGKPKSIIISKDDYILDGHHAWAAKLGLDAMDNKLENDSKMNVHRVNISITKLLAEAEKFTGGKGHKAANESESKKSLGEIVGEIVREWDESLHPRDDHGRFGFGGGGSDGIEATSTGGLRAGEGGKADITLTHEDWNKPSLRNDIYGKLLDATAAGPFDGGNVVMAQAIQKVKGGELTALVDANDFAEHAVVKTGNSYSDYAGTGSKEEVIAHFNELENVEIVDVRPLTDSDMTSALRDDKAATEIAAIITGGSPSRKMGPTTPEKFVAARGESKRTAFLSDKSAEQLKTDKLFLSKDGKTGYALDPKGDLQNLFNNGPRGGGKVALDDAIKNGASTLDAFDGHLPILYAKHGFVPTGRMKWNDEYAPKGWDYARYGRPDVVFMAYRGGDRQTIEERAGTFPPYDRSQGPYFTDFDAAKAASRSAVMDKGFGPGVHGVNGVHPEHGWRGEFHQALEGPHGRPAEDGGRLRSVEVGPLAELIERGLRLEDCPRRVYVRSHLLKAHHAIVLMEAEGFDLIPYDGEYIPGTELIDTREWDEGLHPRDEGGRFGFGGGGSDGGGEVENASARVPTKEQYDSVTKSPEFKRWFGNSEEVTKPDGSPMVLYHGGTHEYREFASKMANPEGNWGAGFYFSNSPKDVNVNYAGVGADLDVKIERETERISEDQAITPDEARKQALANIVGSGGLIFPVYVKMEKPFITGGDNETRLDFDAGYNPDTEEYDKPESGGVVDFIRGIREAAQDFGDNQANLDSLVGKITDAAIDGDIKASKLEALFRKDDHIGYLESDDGKLVSNEVFRRGLEEAGFDGIIDVNVAQKFHMEGMDEGTFHYIVFEPTQIKSAIGNSGDFDPKDPDITKEWDEGLHPRDDHGRFGFGSGGDIDGKPPAADKEPASSGPVLHNGPLPKQSIVITTATDEWGNQGRSVEVLINPTHSEAIRFTKESEFSTIRYLQDKHDNIFVWKAEEAIHAQALKALQDLTSEVEFTTTLEDLHEHVGPDLFLSRGDTNFSQATEAQQVFAKAKENARKAEKEERDWNEGAHPREPAGSAGGGQFAGGATGGETEAEAPSAANDYGLSTKEKADLKVFGGGIKVDWKNKKEYDALRSSKSFGETLDKLPKQTGTFYRGMVISKKEAAQFTSVDKTVDIAKHSFASPQRDYAKAFTQLQVLRGPKGSVPIVLSIKNANAVAFGKAGYGASKNRLEVVLPIGGKIKVTSVKDAEFNGVKGFNVVAEYA